MKPHRSHQLNDDSIELVIDELKRDVPDLSANKIAFEKGCRDRRSGDYHFDDDSAPQKFMLLRDYTLNYPLPDCQTEENTTPSLPSFSTVYG